MTGLEHVREQAAEIRAQYADASETLRDYYAAAEISDDYAEADAYSDDYGQWCAEWLRALLELVYEIPLKDRVYARLADYPQAFASIAADLKADPVALREALLELHAEGKADVTCSARSCSGSYSRFGGWRRVSTGETGGA